MKGAQSVWAVTFRVDGVPAPQGSKTMGKTKSGRSYVRESSARVKPWRRAVQAAAAAQGLMVPVGSASSVEVMFMVERPRTHLGTGRNALTVKRSAPAFPTSKAVGDIDKLVRATLDGLTQSGIIADDAHVCDAPARKRYASPGCPSHAVITVRSLEGPLVARASSPRAA